MYQGLLYIHSFIRYIVLVLLVIVIVTSLLGWLNRKSFTKADDKFSLFLLIGTHTQLLIGLLLYFVSPFVQFNSSTMKVADTRYWTVEHISMMLIAVTLITVARITHKKISSDEGKFKRLFYLNTIALMVIIGAIVMSHRGLLASSLFSN
jgi:hypothetical protein